MLSRATPRAPGSLRPRAGALAPALSRAGRAALHLAVTASETRGLQECGRGGERGSGDSCRRVVARPGSSKRHLQSCPVVQSPSDALMLTARWPVCPGRGVWSTSVSAAEGRGKACRRGMEGGAAGEEQAPLRALPPENTGTSALP